MDLVNMVQKAGVAGEGGAGFPTYVKLNTKAEIFIVNAAECEPLLLVDQFLCRTFPETIVETTLKVAEHLGAGIAYIVLKEKYTEEVAALKKAVEKVAACGKKPEIRIFEMQSYYPAGDEQVMVEAVTKRVVPEQGLPIHVGCVVSNVGTIRSIADALLDKPVTWKYISVTGAVKKPSLFHVPIGTPISEILKRSSISLKEYAVILGGPMMGTVLNSEAEILEASVNKTLGNLLILPKEHYLIRMAGLSPTRMILQAMSACISCKMCTDLCPRFILGHEIRPDRVMRNVWREEKMEDEAYLSAFGSSVNCCSCGVCELFACPMGLSPRKMNIYMKKLLGDRNLKPELCKNPSVRSGITHHRIPTERLIIKLDLKKYETHDKPEAEEFIPEKLTVDLKQHIGKPALSVVHEGDAVEAGDLIGSADLGLSLNVHTGVSGVVEAVGTDRITINVKRVCI